MTDPIEQRARIDVGAEPAVALTDVDVVLVIASARVTEPAVQRYPGRWTRHLGLTEICGRVSPGPGGAHP